MNIAVHLLDAAQKQTRNFAEMLNSFKENPTNFMRQFNINNFSATL